MQNFILNNNVLSNIKRTNNNVTNKSLEKNFHFIGTALLYSLYI